MNKKFFALKSLALLMLFASVGVQARNTDYEVLSADTASVKSCKSGCCCAANSRELLDKLWQLKQVSHADRLETQLYKEKYVVQFTQQVDPQDGSKGTFRQRVIVCHRGFDRPTVLVTEGYWATYALRPGYEEELSKILDANVVCVEDRYFAESTPDPCDWDCLTVANSLNDLHEIVTAFKAIYTGKWISTGISKGGQTTMFYRAYYPDDVDVSVPYVTPLNTALEDKRPAKFISDKVGTAEERQRVKDFQTELLKRRATLVPIFEKYCKEKGYEFRLPIGQIYDLDVMEFSFALWQWGTPVGQLPALTSDDDTLFKYFIGICEPDYFSTSTIFNSFNIQAARELGYYAYDLKPFLKYTEMKDAKDYMHRVMLAPEHSNVKFDKTLYNYTRKFLEQNDPKMIYIYGDIDPWGACGVNTWLDTSKKKNLKVYVCPRGSHSTRINTFEEKTRDEIIGLLKSWLE